MHSRIAAMAVAVMMIAIAGTTAIASIGDADATGAIGDFDFYLDTDSGYVKYESTGINASAALSSQSALLTAMDSTVDNAFSKQYHNEYGDYTSINTEWGAITKNAASAVEGSQWNVYVYTFDGTNGVGQWKIADKTLGFYKPFDDYSGAYATANVALSYGPATTVAPSDLPSAGLQNLTAVTETATYAVNFEIRYDGADETIYTTVTGYGSDAAIALKKAVGDSVTLDMTVGVSYGYLVSLFGKATDDSSGSWMWWQMRNDSKADTQLVESQFYLGFYTAITGFDLSCNNISLIYGDGSLFE